ncbi:MAG: hypothetical protein WKG32_13005 [Gemmatimonadaceae bacterium]
MPGCRPKIIRDYARWTALSALRSGAPIKSRADIYPLLDDAAFGVVLDGKEPIGREEFDRWHEAATLALVERRPKLGVGWATKLLNVYLKTAAYVGDLAAAPRSDVASATTAVVIASEPGRLPLDSAKR